MIKGLISTDAFLSTDYKINQAKKEHYLSKLYQSNGNTSTTWKVINEILNKKMKERNIHKINLDNLIMNDPYSIAKAFNTFYSNVPKTIKESCPYAHYIPTNHINEDHNRYTMELRDVSPDDVINTINKLKNTTSKGIDDCMKICLIKK